MVKTFKKKLAINYGWMLFNILSKRQIKVISRCSIYSSRWYLLFPRSFSGEEVLIPEGHQTRNDEWTRNHQKNHQKGKSKKQKNYGTLGNVC